MRVFISYSRANQKRALRLVKELTTRGIEVWFDEFDVLVGHNIADAVYNGIRNSQYLFVVLTKAAVKSRWVKEELDHARAEEIEKGRVKVVPLLFERCEIPEALRRKRYADFTGTFEKGVLQLIALLKAEVVTTSDGVHTRDENRLRSNQQLAAGALGRRLATFFSNLSYVFRYSVVASDAAREHFVFYLDDFWEKLGSVTGASKSQFAEYVRMRGIVEGTHLTEKSFADLVFGPRNISQRDDAMEYASILGISPLLSRKLLQFFEANSLEIDKVVDDYLDIRGALGSEIARKYPVDYGAAMLFYADIGIVCFMVGGNSCDHLTSDADAFQIVRDAIARAVDSARYLDGQELWHSETECGKAWSMLSFDDNSSSSDLSTVMQDIDHKLKMRH